MAIELVDFRATAVMLSRNFILWAIVRGLDRRRVFKFASDEPFGSGQVHVTSTRAGLHRGAELPRRGRGAARTCKARSTTLVDDATGAPLATGERDTDRPAIYFRRRRRRCRRA